MACCSRLSPIPTSMELQPTMHLTPDVTIDDRDPRKAVSWNFERDESMLTRSFAHRSKNDIALPAPHFPQYNPDSPEMLRTPQRPFPKYLPAKLEFSPLSQNSQEVSISIYGLNYPNRQALREAPCLITSIDVIYSSPIIQESIHHLLADHALDKAKTEQTVRYLGLSDATFFEYLRQSYPRHYWAHLGDKC